MKKPIFYILFSLGVFVSAFLVSARAEEAEAPASGPEGGFPVYYVDPSANKIYSGADKDDPIILDASGSAPAPLEEPETGEKTTAAEPVEGGGDAEAAGAAAEPAAGGSGEDTFEGDLPDAAADSGETESQADPEETAGLDARPAPARPATSVPEIARENASQGPATSAPADASLDDKEEDPAVPASAFAKENGGNAEAGQADAAEEKPADQAESAPEEEAAVLGADQSFNTAIIRKEKFTKTAIIAQWQMLAEDDNMESGQDDSLAPGAQILPSGAYKTDREYEACVLAAGGGSEISSLRIRTFYPREAGYAGGKSPRGCGALKEEAELAALSPQAAYALVCGNIRENNNNLLVWSKSDSGYVYAYDQVCGREGALEQGEAAVFCGRLSLFYDDPAGSYRTEASALNNRGEADLEESFFKYLELTMFEADFSDFKYGLVEEGVWKTVLGDNVWGAQSLPTVRNIGNTRLRIAIDQNDFGFGAGKSGWNVNYRARIGREADFTPYLPDEPMILAAVLDLGAVKELDLSVLVKKFPDRADRPDFSGQMTLQNLAVEPYGCEN